MHGHSDEGKRERGKGEEKGHRRTGDDGHIIPVQEWLQHGLGRHAVQGVLFNLGTKDMVVGEGTVPHTDLLAVVPGVLHHHLRAHGHLVGQQGTHPHPDPHLGLHRLVYRCLRCRREGKVAECLLGWMHHAWRARHKNKK